jgi:hypothetical protein
MKTATPWHNPELNWRNHMQMSMNRLTSTLGVLLLTLGFAQHAETAVPGTTLPETPDGTVVVIAQQLLDHHPEIIWEALPKSYRADINEITSTFAEKMDPEIYNHAFSLVMRAIEVLDDRKDIILASETFRSSGADGEEIRTGLANTQAYIETLKASEIATLEGLGKVNWKRFLATTGAQMLEHASSIETADGANPLDDLSTLKVETLDLSDDRATLRISSEDREPEEVEMALVEGRWIPADMAGEWPKQSAEVRKGLAEFTPEEMAAKKTQIMMFFGMADALIEQIASLQTPEEFDAAIGPMLAPFMGAASMGMMSDEEGWEEPEDD